MKQMQVAIGIIRHPGRGIFITKRAKNVHMGGFWEFPGGKIEANEAPFDALKRELWEETHINIEIAVPFLQIKHAYPELTVILHVYLVSAWRGDPYGKEGQPCRWIQQHELNAGDFPIANHKIVENLLAEIK